jgi:hypothetical protein
MNAGSQHLSIYGEWLQPANQWQGTENSIHTDSVARRVGMRGGTIPGTVHLTHFRPLLSKLFGERWLARGCISMYYTYATLHGEPVRAVIAAPPGPSKEPIQLDAWVETREGKVVCKGTVSVGHPPAASYVRALPLVNAPSGANRILSKLHPGELLGPVEMQPIGGGENGEIRDPQHMYRALMVPLPNVQKPSVGFFGATEIILRSGPIRTDVKYLKSGVVVCIGHSPKTEFAWLDTTLEDQTGTVVAEMRHMTRWMKASSPLWAT